MLDWIAKLEARDWIVVAATIVGPILAVQAQKTVESFRAYRDRKLGIFNALMATRRERLNFSHVQALNGIDLAFYGRRFMGRRKTEQDVLDAWKEYLHLLSKPADQNPNWAQDRDRLFVELLVKIATDVGFRFDRVQLETGAYSPKAHGDLEEAQLELITSAAKVFAGKRPLNLKVVEMPPEYSQQSSPPTPDVRRELAQAVSKRGPAT
ncbi:MAG: DUF6680 family protein [Betaproteobacteria bacterium]|jgi:hypothetical protein